MNLKVYELIVMIYPCVDTFTNKNAEIATSPAGAGFSQWQQVVNSITFVNCLFERSREIFKQKVHESVNT